MVAIGNSVAERRDNRKKRSRFGRIRRHLFGNDRRQRKNVANCRIRWADHVKQLKPGEFDRRYRMTEAKFDNLLESLAEANVFFQRVGALQAVKIQNLHGSPPIDPRHKLAVALWWMCGGSHLDIRLVHGVGMRTVYECLWQTVDTINKIHHLEFPWDDEIKLAELEKGFADLSGGKVRGCVFAVDGFCVRIRCPSHVVNSRDYWNRKGFYSYVVQAVVDSKGKFMAASTKAVGNTHDSLALQMSKFYAKLEEGKLARNVGFAGLQSYYGMGDDAYADAEYLVTPWPGRNLPDDRDNFNYWQSRLRIVVECAFGRLTKRFGCLWRPLSVHCSRVPALISALLKLHNYCGDSTVAHNPEDVQHFMQKQMSPCIFDNSGPLQGAELTQYRQMRRLGHTSNTRYTSVCMCTHSYIHHTYIPSCIHTYTGWHSPTIWRALARLAHRIQGLSCIHIYIEYVCVHVCVLQVPRTGASSDQTISAHVHKRRATSSCRSATTSWAAAATTTTTTIIIITTQARYAAPAPAQAQGQKLRVVIMQIFPSQSSPPTTNGGRLRSCRLRSFCYSAHVADCKNRRAAAPPPRPQDETQWSCPAAPVQTVDVWITG